MSKKVNDVQDNLEYIIKLIKEINTKLNSLINDNVNKKYFIKVGKRYLNAVTDPNVPYYPFTLYNKDETGTFKTKFTTDEVELLKRDDDLKWLNWDVVTLEEVQNNETKQ